MDMCRAGSIRAECREVKLACNRGVPSDGTPEAGSRMVKLGCLLKQVLSLTIVDPEMVKVEKPGVLCTEDEGCLRGLRRTSGVHFKFSTSLWGV